DRDDRQAGVEVFAEEALCGERREIAIRRRQQAEVHFVPLVLTETTDDAVFEDPEELDLRLERRVVDLVEKDRAALRGHQLAVVLLHGARERPARVAEQLGLHQVVRNRAAVDWNERLGPARGPRVNR